MLVRTFASAVTGIDAVTVTIEVNVSLGVRFFLVGPPGSGKTMLSKRLPTIMPALTLEEVLETTKIHYVAGKIEDHTV